jgi:acetyl esterase/lipase
VTRKTFYAIFAAGIALLCLAAWPFAKAHLQAVAVLRSVAAQPVPWIARDLTVPVTTEEFSFPIESASGHEQVRARLYIPQNKSHAPAMVIFHGVHYLGIDEPRLMSFASAMAGCGIRVLTPELPGIKDYHVSQDSVEMIGESVRWFAAQTGGPVGVMGLSFCGDRPALSCGLQVRRRGGLAGLDAARGRVLPDGPRRTSRWLGGGAAAA